LLNGYFERASYAKQVTVSKLGILPVNSILFCNAIENLVKNGLKYNNSENKSISIFIEDNHIIVQDNGIGMTDKQFKTHLKSVSNADNDEIGLGLNISFAILKEHGFDMECEKNEIGTKIKIKVK
jgi:signal transduction histidine kinase